MPLRVFSAALLGASLFGSPIATFTNRTAFDTAVGPTTTFHFNSLADDTPVSTLTSPAGVELAKVKTPGGDDQGAAFLQGLCGSRMGLARCFGVQLVLPARVFAIGFDNVDMNEVVEAVVAVKFADGSEKTYTFDLRGQAAFTPVFFGLKSEVAIHSVFNTARRKDNPATTLASVVDNVSIAAPTPIPEPSTFAAAVAALALGWAARRRCA